MELNGKIACFLGDSITEGVGVKDRANNRYDNRLAKACGLKAVYNYGIGGTRIAHQYQPSEDACRDMTFCGRAFFLNPEADLFVVYGGINDYIHGDAPFGKIGDRTQATFCGAVWYLMNTLRTRYAGKTVVFLTPAHCYFKGVSDAEVSPRPMKAPDSKPVLGYVEAILETAKEFDVPVLDLYHDLGITPNEEEDRAKYTTDGLHFNDDGHAVIAAKLQAFLEGQV